jgi:hypothetical protein
MVARVLTVLLVVAVHAHNLQAAFQCAFNAGSGTEAKNGSGVDVADVEIRIDIVGVRGEEVARIVVWVLLQQLFEVFQRSPIRFAGHLSMLAESLVRRPVFFLMIATAVENYEATFAGVEASLGFANCALVFVRERGDGRHLGRFVWLSKENYRL